MKTHLLATVVLTTACLAQTPTPSAPAVAPTTAPAAAVRPPHLLLDTVGPDGWRIRLGPTNLGSLLASEQGRGLWQPQILPLLGQWRQLLGDDDAANDAQQRLLGHQGRIRLGVWFDTDPRSRNQVAGMALVLEGDGRTDMARIAAELQQLQGQLLPGERQQLAVDGQNRDVVVLDDQVVTAPFVVGHNVLLLGSTHDALASTFASATALAADATGIAPKPVGPALRLSLDLPTLVAQLQAENDDDSNAAMTAAGLGSLGMASMSIGAAGPHVQFELAQQFTRDERGVFAALFPATAGVPAAHGLVPAGAGSWKVGRFDFHALYRAVLQILSAMEKGSADELQAEMQKELGLDLGADLLAHTTDDVVFFHSSVQDLERPEDVTWTLAIGLRDRAKFAAGMTTLLAHSRPFLNREATSTVDGVELHRYGSMIGYDVWFAVGGKHLFVSGGRDAEMQLTQALAAEKAPATGQPVAGAAQFDELQRFLPPGTNGHARSELDALVALPTTWWLMALREVAPLPIGGSGEDDDEARGARRALLRQHRLDVLRTATGYAERTWRWRLFW